MELKNLFLSLIILLYFFCFIEGCTSSYKINNRSELKTLTKTGPMTVLTSDSSLYEIDYFLIKDSVLTGKGSVEKEGKVSPFNGVIKMKDILYIQAEKTDVIKTIAGVGIAGFFAFTAASYLSKDNNLILHENIKYPPLKLSCPFVYAYDGKNYYLESETFAGAIFRKAERFNILLKQLKMFYPDVIFLQEANPVSEYSSRLADSLGFDEIHQVCNAGIKFGPFGFPSNFKEGISILANRKLQLKYFDVWKLGGSFGVFGDAVTIHFDESNFALTGKILVDSSPIYLVNLHLANAVAADSILKIKYESYLKENSIAMDEANNAFREWDFKKEKQNDELEAFSEQLNKIPNGYPFVIGGDFNSTLEGAELKKLVSSHNLIDTFDKNNSTQIFTWDPLRNENVSYSTNPFDAEGNKLQRYDLLSTMYDSFPRRIDYIFLCNRFPKDDILSYKIIMDSAKNSIHASDHFGVYSEINLTQILSSTPKEFSKITSLQDKTIEPFPIISYDTDIGFGYGAKAFFLNQLDLNESFDLTFFNSTKGERWYRFVLSIPDFELRQGKIYPLAFDFIVDYDKYIKNNFFGVGNNSSFSNREYYTKEPLEMNLGFSRGFTNNFVGQIGMRYKYARNFNIADTSAIWELPSKLSTSKVNFTSAFINLRYDTRNSFINPSEGIVLQGESEIVFKSSLASVSFNRYAGCFQYYKTLFYPKTIGFYFNFGQIF